MYGGNDRRGFMTGQIGTERMGRRRQKEEQTAEEERTNDKRGNNRQKRERIIERNERVKTHMPKTPYMNQKGISTEQRTYKAK